MSTAAMTEVAVKMKTAAVVIIKPPSHFESETSISFIRRIILHQLF